MGVFDILLALLALSLLIIIHEIGHFAAAKLCGIRVLEFAIFMGPKIFSKKIGETEYSIRSVPIGGFVKMEGEEETSTDSRAYNKKPVHLRALVIFAGPFMNLLAALLIILFIFAYSGYPTTTISNLAAGFPAENAGIKVGDQLYSIEGSKIYSPTIDAETFTFIDTSGKYNISVLRDGQIIDYSLQLQRYRHVLGFSPVDTKSEIGADSNLVKEVTIGYPAEKSGLKPNDRIIKITGQNKTVNINTRKDVADFLKQNADKPIKITVLRNGQSVDLNEIKPKLEKYPALYAMGIQSFQPGRGNFFETFTYSINNLYAISRSILKSLLWLVTGKVSLSQMMGPVGIVTQIGSVVAQSPTVMDKIISILDTMVLISINLGLFNLIPFPALDGSKLVILAVEAVRRKALPPEKEAMITLIGMSLLIMLMLFTLFNDSMRLITGG
jgi:regulator of sigma E protease